MLKDQTQKKTGTLLFPALCHSDITLYRAKPLNLSIAKQWGLRSAVSQLRLPLKEGYLALGGIAATVSQIAV